MPRHNDSLRHIAVTRRPLEDYQGARSGSQDIPRDILETKGLVKRPKVEPLFDTGPLSMTVPLLVWMRGLEKHAFVVNCVA